MDLEERVGNRRGGRDGGKLSRVAVRGRKGMVGRARARARGVRGVSATRSE